MIVAFNKAWGRMVMSLLAATTLVVLGILGWAGMYAGRTIHDLLGENAALRNAIANLSEENQIGYAKVLDQYERDGRLFTRLLFVETDRRDPTQRILQREYEIEGDVVFFDALVVRFGRDLVMSGEAKSLYLWRRIYGEKQSPESGYPIEAEGAEPARYADLTARLKLKERRLFWEEIWNLANDPSRLEEIGVKAINGNVIYQQLRPGLIYIFRIDAAGGLTQEVVPDL